VTTSLAMTIWHGFLHALGALLDGAIALLPGMPTLPAMPGPMVTALGWVSWAFPVGTVVHIFGFIAGAWLLWQVVAALMRWLKLLAI
jgi:hypothetical protein